MKRYYFLTMLLAFFASTLFAQTNYKMVVEKTDGTRTYFNNNEIKQVFFQEVEEGTPFENLLKGDSFDFEGGTLGYWDWWFNGNYRSYSSSDYQPASTNRGIGVGNGNVTAAAPGYQSNYCAVLTNYYANGEDNSYLSQFAYKFNFYLEQGKTYKLQFYAKSDRADGSLTFCHQNSSTYDHQIWKTFQIGKEWTMYEYEFIMEYNDVDRILFNFGALAGTYYLDNIQFGIVEGVTPPVDAIDVVGTWNIVSGSEKRYENGVLVNEESGNATAPYNRIVFYDNGTMEYLEYSSSKGTWHEDGRGTYIMDGTALVYTGGDWDYFEITAVNNVDEMEVVYQFTEDKGNTLVKKAYRSKLQRTTENTPRDDEGGDDTVILEWDYYNYISSLIPDNGLYYRNRVNDDNGMHGVKLNSEGYCYFAKPAVAGTLTLTFGNRNNNSAYAVNVYTCIGADGANGVKGTLIGEVAIAESPGTGSIYIGADVTGIWIERKTHSEGVLQKIVFTSGGSDTSTIKESDLIGTWKSEGSETSNGTTYTWTDVATFNSDNTGESKCIESNGDVSEHFYFTWSLSGNTLHITPTGGNYDNDIITTFTIMSVNSTILVINNGEKTITWTKDNGEDNPDNPSTGTYQGAKRIFGNVLLGSIYNVNDNYTLAFTYDSKGFPTKMTSNSNNKNIEMIPSYSDGQIVIRAYNANTFLSQYIITIGDKGYASKVEFTDDKGNPEVLYLSYNDNEQLSKIQWGEDVNDIYQFVYSDGDVIRVEGSDGSWDVYYETATQSKIQNSGNFMLWDEMLDVDMDDLEALHFWGLLGKSTTHLPLSYAKQSSSETRYYTNHYEIDSNGRITQFYYSRNNGGTSEYDSDVLRMTWNY